MSGDIMQPANFDAWRLDNAIELESDAEQTAWIINQYIADSVDLTAMSAAAVADADESTVTLFIGELHCGEFRWDHALAHWRQELATAFSKAMSESRPRMAG